jgi:translation initiation factor IF-3
VPEVRVVDEEGEQLGVMPTSEALAMAEQRGYDLVEVAPAAKPPVCRMMDFGKFKYEATRKERESRKAQKSRVTNVLREVRMKTRIGVHDRLAKTRLVKRLLDQGSKVKVSVMFRGREVEHPEVGMVLLKAVADDLIDDALLESAPRFESRRSLSMILSPPLNKADPADKSEDQDQAESVTEAAADVEPAAAPAEEAEPVVKVEAVAKPAEKVLNSAEA